MTTVRTRTKLAFTHLARLPRRGSAATGGSPPGDGPPRRRPTSAAQRRRRRVGATLTGCVVAALTLHPGSAHAADDTFVSGFDPSAFTAGLPTDGDSLRASAILANANRYALTTWWTTAKDFDAQTGTYLDFGGIVENNIRPPASEAYALAVALQTGQYDPAVTGVPEATARAIATKLIRSLAYRHRVNTAGGWGYGWQTAYWTALAGTAGWLLWDDLTTGDREQVRKMVEYEANRFIGWQVPYLKDRTGALARPCGDTAAEESAWNARLLFLAPVLMPQHSRRSGWTYKANELSVSAFARPADLTDATDMRGRPLRDWLEGSNVDDDGALLNHSQYHPDYMTTITESMSGAFVPALAGRPVPANALHGANLQYDAMVDKPWWPAPLPLPCPDSPSYKAPGANNPNGTIYVDGTETIYYPHGWEAGPLRHAAFSTLDTIVRAFGLDDLVAEKADTWEDLHAQHVLAMQQRPLAGGAPSDGRMYRADSEDIYAGREEWVAARAAEAWLAKWLTHQGALGQTNAADQIVIDNADRGVTVTGTWTTGSPAANGPQVFGPSVRYKTAGTGTSSVRFTPRMSHTRSYKVYAWWISAPGQATNTPFTIAHTGGTTVVTKNQQTAGGQWVLLGTYTLGPGSYVQVNDNANGYVVADGILLDPS